MWPRGRETTGVGGVEVEVEEAGEALRVEEEEEGEDPLMTGDLQGGMTGDLQGEMTGEEGVMVEEMEVVIEMTKEEESVVTGMEEEEEEVVVVVVVDRMNMPTLV